MVFLIVDLPISTAVCIVNDYISDYDVCSLDTATSPGNKRNLLLKLIHIYVLVQLVSNVHSYKKQKSSKIVWLNARQIKFHELILKREISRKFFERLKKSCTSLLRTLFLGNNDHEPSKLSAYERWTCVAFRGANIALKYDDIIRNKLDSKIFNQLTSLAVATLRISTTALKHLATHCANLLALEIYSESKFIDEQSLISIIFANKNLTTITFHTPLIFTGQILTTITNHCIEIQSVCILNFKVTAWDEAIQLIETCTKLQRLQVKSNDVTFTFTYDTKENTSIRGERSVLQRVLTCNPYIYTEDNHDFNHFIKLFSRIQDFTGLSLIIFSGYKLSTSVTATLLCDTIALIKQSELAYTSFVLWSQHCNASNYSQNFADTTEWITVPYSCKFSTIL